MPMTSFRPTRHGFHFSNEFVNHIVDIPGRGAIATAGRCGGMAYAALDYYFAGIAIPTHLREDFPSGRVPDDSSRLARYIYRRLLESFVDGGVNFVAWTLYPDSGNALTKGVARLTSEDEIPKLCRQIDVGQPSAIGLIKANSLVDIGQNHQVVAYGYTHDSASRKTTIYIYDNNYPDRNDVVLVADSSTPEIAEQIQGEVITTWRGLFVQSYGRRTPEYRDLALTTGIWVSSSSPVPGTPFQCGYTVRNLGDYPAHIQGARLYLGEPPDGISERYVDAESVAERLDPGEETTVTHSFDFSSEKTGSYRLRATYYTVQGEWIDIPASSPSAANGVTVTVNR